MGIYVTFIQLFKHFAIASFVLVVPLMLHLNSEEVIRPAVI